MDGKINYWTFKHKPGPEGGKYAIGFVEKAIKLNSALMQYEYDYQDQGMVTQNWNRIQKVQEGDYLFLRGDAHIYAVGRVIQPRKKSDVILSIREIIDNKSNGEYISGKYFGCIHFKENSVFYEDLSDGSDEWGQRIDVDGWKYYFSEGIYAKDQDSYIASEPEHGVLKQLKEESALKFIEKLKSKYMGTERGLLESNKNIILTGAPGTGKTYLAKQIALQMLFEKNDEFLLTEDEKEVFKTHYCFVQFHPSFDYTDFVEGLRPFKEDGQKELGFSLKDGIFMEFCKRARDEKDPSKKFVFVIDEINRGEISKIFGELFFCIDPGYRGIEGKVKTQYANLREERDQYFYVPDNVYIIGTMNDIDRSIESFDFAIRRRFTWIEVSSKDRIGMWDDPQKGIGEFKYIAERKMNNLNRCIEDIPALGKDFHIGPAYFLKLRDYKGDTKQLWDNHLRSLLKEYLRGMLDGESLMIKFEAAYNQ